MPEYVKLAGVALCKPYEQGDLDSLCGVYAALNAISLVTAPIRPLSRIHAQQVFHAGLDYLERRHGLSGTLKNGMNFQRQHALTRDMTSAASKKTGLHITIQKVFPGRFGHNDAPTPAQLSSSIAEQITNGAALLIEMRKTWHHYTVISGITLSRVILFDSDGLRWIDRKTITTTNNDNKCRHHIVLTSMLAINIARQ